MGAAKFPAMDLSNLRRDYANESLTERDVDPDPIRQFEKWFGQATHAGMIEPNAMTLATSTRDGRFALTSSWRPASGPSTMDSVKRGVSSPGRSSLGRAAVA